uniref:RING-type domain-containing protein n=1 Tax=Parastrongyloides trichosuri TaxID=131310 RepID=A0A0N4ZBJ6_PARTI
MKAFNVLVRCILVRNDKDSIDSRTKQRVLNIPKRNIEYIYVSFGGLERKCYERMYYGLRHSFVSTIKMTDSDNNKRKRLDVSLKLKHDSVGSKIGLPWKDPFEILKVDGYKITIKDGNKSEAIHFSNFKDNVCFLCKEPFSGSGSDHEMASLPCGHTMGRSCIQDYFLKSLSSKDCPICLIHISAAILCNKTSKNAVQNLNIEQVEDKNPYIKSDPEPLKNKIYFKDDTDHLLKEDASGCDSEISKKL